MSYGRTTGFLAAWFGGLCLVLSAFPAHAQIVATTTVYVSICGNGIVDPGEVCDDGIDSGAYATSVAGKICLPNCQGWGPYCGDGILQQVYGEQCDDGNNASGDGCSATCQIESTAPTPGAGTPTSYGAYTGGQSVMPNPTQVIVKGKAYPDANVNILDDGVAIGVVQADSSANFYFSTTNVSPGVATFSFWAQDAAGLKSVSLTTTVNGDSERRDDYIGRIPAADDQHRQASAEAGR